MFAQISKVWRLAKRSFNNTYGHPNWEYIEALEKHLIFKGFAYRPDGRLPQALIDKIRKQERANFYLSSYEISQGREAVNVIILSVSAERDPAHVNIRLLVGFPADHQAPRICADTTYFDYIHRLPTADMLSDFIGTISVPSISVEAMDDLCLAGQRGVANAKPPQFRCHIP